MPIEKICPACGKKFKVFPSEDRVKYCSRACSNNDKWRRHISDAIRGKKHSLETRAKMSKAHRKYSWTYNDLYKLYWEEGKSEAEIAKALRAGVGTVHKWMVILGVKRRGRLESQRVNVNLGDSEELAYLLGVLLGDGTINIRFHKVKLAVKDLPFATSFYKALKEIGFRPSKPIKREHPYGSLYHVESNSKDFTEWFKKLKLEDIEKLILSREKFIIAFLRGLYESDGSTPKKSNSRIYNTDKALIDMTKRLIENIGFTPSLKGPYKNVPKYPSLPSIILGREYKQCYHLHIPKYETERFLELINPSIKR